MKRWAGQNEKLHRRAKAMERRVERYEADMLPEARPDAATTRFPSRARERPTWCSTPST
jgi:hypothetical protein